MALWFFSEMKTLENSWVGMIIGRFIQYKPPTHHNLPFFHPGIISLNQRFCTRLLYMLCYYFLHKIFLFMRWFACEIDEYHFSRRCSLTWLACRNIMNTLFQQLQMKKNDYFMSLGSWQQTQIQNANLWDLKCEIGFRLISTGIVWKIRLFQHIYFNT